MYIVKLINGEVVTEIHGFKEKLKSGTVQKGINAIDSFSFVLLPSNDGFDKIRDLQTLVTVFNTNKNRYEFHGRVIFSHDDMDEKGLITKEVTCESYIGFLNDSRQNYVAEQNWTVTELLEHIINTHNSKVEDYKKFTIGEVTVTDPNDNLYLGIQRENTWQTIEEKLVKKLGGEIRFRVVDGVTYLDYLTQIGEMKATPIKLSRNMKMISREKDPTSYITRLIPYGSKIQREEVSVDQEGNETVELIETEERLDITEVNNGLDYIEDEEARKAFGIIEGVVEFDDVQDATNLYRKGQEYLIANNKVLVKYTITALDLSLIGLDIDDFDVCNTHPIVNPLLGIDDTARIIKKTIDVVNESPASSIEVGDNFKTLTDIQLEQIKQTETNTTTIGEIISNYATNEKLRSESLHLTSMINQTVESILLSVEEVYAQKEGLEEWKQTISSQLAVLAEEITMKFTQTSQKIESVDGDLQSKYNTITKYFQFSLNGLTIGQEGSPFKVVIDNDLLVMYINGVPAIALDPDGNSIIPTLTVSNVLNLLGYEIELDENENLNCSYSGAITYVEPNRNIQLFTLDGMAVQTSDGMMVYLKE